VVLVLDTVVLRLLFAGNMFQHLRLWPPVKGRGKEQTP